MKHLYRLDQISPSASTLVGEKASILSQLKQQGYPVVPGFVVSAAAMQELLQVLGAAEPFFSDLSDSSLYVDVDDCEILQSLTQRLRQGILTAPLSASLLSGAIADAQAWNSPALIVRPSLTWSGDRLQNAAGLMRSRSCWCQSEDLELALKWVWAEQFRASSLFCWQRRGLSLAEIDLALVVQPLREAIASGVVEIQQAQEAEIRAVWGLGHSLARGQVQPDVYRVHLETGNIQSRQLGIKTVAYDLKDSPGKSRDCLQLSPLDGDRQQAFALSDVALEELILLTQNLARDRHNICYIEWTLFPDGTKSQLSLTQGSYDLRTIAPYSTPSPMNAASGLLKGLSASPGRVAATAYTISDPIFLPSSIPPGRILVAQTISPKWLPLLKQAAGVVTEEGGLTSHAAIIARELGIPAAIGVPHATRQIKTGESLFLDGIQGEVRRQVEDEPLPNPQTDASVAAAMSSSPARVPIATQLLVNLSQMSSIAQAAALPVDGVGLLRSELAILELLDSQHLSWWLQDSQKPVFVKRLTECIRQFAFHFAPRPVFYRSNDWRLPEFPSLAEPSHLPRAEINPILGRRGTLNYVLDSTLFDAELEALAGLQEQGYSNINLLLPFIRSVPEFIFCRDRARKFGLTQQPGFQLWIMAEVPSVFFLLPDYVRAGVQGISIGTNDLTQLLLGVDREQADLTRRFDERNPAVLRAIQQLIELARIENIPCSICGQAPVQYPELVEKLVHWGISSISVEPDAVEQTYWAIARGEQRLLLKAARGKSSQSQ